MSRELHEELGEYLEMAADEKMKQGMSRQDALLAVRLEGGSLDGTKEIVRSDGWESVVDAWWRDLLFAARMLPKARHRRPLDLLRDASQTAELAPRPGQRRRGNHGA